MKVSTTPASYYHTITPPTTAAALPPDPKQLLLFEMRRRTDTTKLLKSVNDIQCGRANNRWHRQVGKPTTHSKEQQLLSSSIVPDDWKKVLRWQHPYLGVQMSWHMYYYSTVDLYSIIRVPDTISNPYDSTPYRVSVFYFRPSTPIYIYIYISTPNTKTVLLFWRHLGRERKGCVSPSHPRLCRYAQNS